MRVDKASELRTISSVSVVVARVRDIGNESGADQLLSRDVMRHAGRRGEQQSFREQDFAELWLDDAHRQPGGTTVLVWDINFTQHKDALMCELLAARGRRLTVFWLPAHAPDPNPPEGMWANLMNYLGNLVACTVDTLAELTRTRLKKMQYRPDLLDGFIAETASPGHRRDVTLKRKPQQRRPPRQPWALSS